MSSSCSITPKCLETQREQVPELYLQLRFWQEALVAQGSVTLLVCVVSPDNNSPTLLPTAGKEPLRGGRRSSAGRWSARSGQGRLEGEEAPSKTCAEPAGMSR